MGTITEIVECRWLDYDNYIELYEAVYLFSKIRSAGFEKSGITQSAYKAAVRILTVCGLLDDAEKQRHILNNIIGEDRTNHYAEFLSKATNKSQFFFDSISELEYEIYSRCNFEVTFDIGVEVAKYVDFSKTKVLELGGNSGGLGAALLTTYMDCRHTVVDTQIPCAVGNEINETRKQNITFIEGNAFELRLPPEKYDYIVLSNLLHDFDDEKCLRILRNCKKHCGRGTKFVVIEDILTGELEPKEVVMHGLRLSVECRGGRQRTADEIAGLFAKIEYDLDENIKLSNIHTMLVMGAV